MELLAGTGFGLTKPLDACGCCVKLNKLSLLLGKPESSLDVDEPLEAAASPGNGKAGLVVPTASGEVFA